MSEMDDDTSDADAEWREEWAARYGVKRAKRAGEDVWREIRRGWERGETAQSLAKRYDVGLSNLWRRRAAEFWSRAEPDRRPPEPPGGWDMYAHGRWEAFVEMLDDTRRVARALADWMAGGAEPHGLPLWHLGFAMRWRAEALGEAVAEADREKYAGEDWAGAVWREDGSLKPGDLSDHELARVDRALWRTWAGLPEGAARHRP